MKLILKPIAAVLLFYFLQWGVTTLAGAIFDPITPMILAISYLFIGIVMAFFLYMMHMLQQTTFDPGYLDIRHAHLGVIAPLLGIFVADLLNGKINLPDWNNPDYYIMARSYWGVLAMAFIGPFTEELVFREGIIGYLRNHDIGKWTAVIASTILFTLVHFNPSQILVTIVGGVLLGIVYLKSRSIILTTIINSTYSLVGVMELRRFGAMAVGFNFTQILGHHLTQLYMLICTILCYLFMREFLKKYHRRHRRSRRHHHHRH